MGQAITTTVAFTKWPNEAGPFTTQEQLDVCAEELWTGLDPNGHPRHIASNMQRGWDADGDFRRLQIHNADGVLGANAEIGNIAILLNGVVQTLTPEEFTGHGFTEQPEDETP